MKSGLILKEVFKNAHKKDGKREKLFKRLEKLRIKNREQLINTNNNLKLEICKMLEIWLDASGTITKKSIKLYRIKDRMQDLISFYKNYHDRLLTPAESYYLKCYVYR